MSLQILLNLHLKHFDAHCADCDSCYVVVCSLLLDYGGKMEGLISIVGPFLVKLTTKIVLGA